MATRPTITLGICLAAGLAAGIGLTRPATTAGDADTTVPPVSAGAIAAADAGPYGSVPVSGPDPAAAPVPAAPATPATAAIRIAGFDFGPPVVVSPGGEVVVDNADGVAHTLTLEPGTSESGSFDTGAIVGGGRAAFNAPTDPGTYRFFCSIHPSMQGSLTVSG